ncbi:trans-sulfuration enzyme family protein [Mariniblastus fucicola]|uniref:Methionine gamma-lyase n=1 Tax=Mariniblastus fucicola TaxID=980251 RepID=A0A5B9PEL5_9BACT|nr:aminotransferase class I/II-fold pyridoxal phosphate-dependent enzyme [Mariniblastus fucicola]QEG23635.1 Methionine gamma-lyase [Mariniblastus fucicola]
MSTVSEQKPTSATQRGISTTSVHAGEARQKALDSITDPIVMASTFTFENTQSIIDYVEQKQERGEYGRYGVPGERVVEKKMAALEGAEEGILFSTGMAAFVGLLNAKLSSGDEIVFFDECYHRSRDYCRTYLSRFGVVTREVKTGDYEAMEAAINSNTKLLVSESPTNPHLSIVDLERFAAIGKTHGVETIIDATLATPYNLQPISYGVDYVMHSATKYLGGHNDLLAGVVLGSKEQLADVRKLRGIMGSINSPHNCFLLERGLKTFELRMQRHNANGMAVARFLEDHPRVERVFYPGLESHPYFETARSQMRGYGGLVTFEVKDADWKETSKIVDAAQLCRIAPSLGGVESLIEQPLVMSYWERTPEQRKEFGITDNMIRLAIGIENAEDVIADLTQCLS